MFILMKKYYTLAYILRSVGSVSDKTSHFGESACRLHSCSVMFFAVRPKCFGSKSNLCPNGLVQHVKNSLRGLNGSITRRTSDKGSGNYRQHLACEAAGKAVSNGSIGSACSVSPGRAKAPPGQLSRRGPCGRGITGNGLTETG